MKKVVFPGSFDPFTNGHIDIVKRLIQQEYKVIILIANNTSKKNLLNVKQRKEIINKATEDLKNVEVKITSDLVVEFCKKNNCKTIVRGLRTVHDFTSEQILAYSNQEIDNEIETIFLLTKAQNIHISSSGVKEFIRFKKDFSNLVPKNTVDLIKKYNQELNEK